MDSELRRAPRFYVLESQRDTPFDTEFSTVEERERTDAPRCPQCGGAVGMMKWLPPYRVKLWLHGDEPGDYIQSNGAGADLIISERFANYFTAEKLTGLQGFDLVEIVRVRQRRRTSGTGLLPRYVAVTVPFGSALVDEASSCILRPGPFDCDYCRAIGSDGINGFSLHPESWNGDDLFYPRGLPGVLVVSERFAHFVKEHQLTNMVLTPTERFVRDPLRRFSQPTEV